jgi:hypothetical protein
LVASCLEPDPALRPTVDELTKGLTVLAQRESRFR